jgi:hypothetical protein
MNQPPAFIRQEIVLNCTAVDNGKGKIVFEIVDAKLLLEKLYPDHYFVLKVSNNTTASLRVTARAKSKKQTQ